MKKNYHSAVALFFLVLAVVAHADAAKSTAPPPSRIEVDPSDGYVKIYVQDELVAVFGTDGLDVRRDTTYGGSLIDHGLRGFDVRHAAPAKGGGRNE